MAQRLLAMLPVARNIDWQQRIAGYWRRGRWSSSIVGYEETGVVSLDNLLHVDAQKNSLVQNTRQLLAGLPANNALLWGARGTGKSSLVHGVLNAHAQEGLRLVEVGKDALADLAEVIEQLAPQPYHFIVFCDDLSFEDDDATYKSLKSVLEGSVLAHAKNVVIYATSNRRHLLAEKPPIMRPVSWLMVNCITARLWRRRFRCLTALVFGYPSTRYGKRSIWIW